MLELIKILQKATQASAKRKIKTEDGATQKKRRTSTTTARHVLDNDNDDDDDDFSIRGSTESSTAHVPTGVIELD